MRTGVNFQLSTTDRKRLQAVIDDRNSAHKHVWRPVIVVGTADGLGMAAIMRTAGVSKTAGKANPDKIIAAATRGRQA